MTTSFVLLPSPSREQRAAVWFAVHPHVDSHVLSRFNASGIHVASNTTTEACTGKSTIDAEFGIAMQECRRYVDSVRRPLQLPLLRLAAADWLLC
jgi:hypothetical protein